MEIRYATKKLQKACEDPSEMRKRFSKDICHKLRLRLFEIKSVDSFQQLTETLGKWEALSGDYKGSWSGRLSANWRIIIRPVHDSTLYPPGVEVALVEEITDYHKR